MSFFGKNDQELAEALGLSEKKLAAWKINRAFRSTRG